MIARLLAKIFGTNNARQLRNLQPIVAEINAFEPRIQILTDAQLAYKTITFREQLSRGRLLDELLPESYAVVREAARRTLGQRHYDVQLMGGIVLHKGSIAEMKTGEGKTLTATLPLYLNALEQKGSHLVTVNDYLARRDAEWMSVVYKALGLNVGIIQHTQSDKERKQAYEADITYATNNELGFDYLRDNMKFRLEDYVQRSLHYAIVDEVDSILIDEARTPLIISGAASESSTLYKEVDRAILRLHAKTDYEVDEKERSVQLTEGGNDKIEALFSINNLYALENLTLLHHVNQALRAHALFKKDVDYVVRDQNVLIVDEFTGRILQGRRYSDGLHQAIEAKEGVTVERENQTLASITLQNFFRLYKKRSGMTGTAVTEAEEFYKIYTLNVISIPTNAPMIREDKPDLIFLTKKAKYAAVVKDVEGRYKKGQPVLIGTISIDASEFLSNILRLHGIPHEVLNAKQHAREAEIVAHAGEKGHVTIATNMAGRGTDIKLTPESVEVGGLYILGTERHESRRIDNQLRGRSGRQGDPGESRFYISLEDDLIRIFGDLKDMMHRFGMEEDEVIESSLVSRSIESSQEKVEKKNFDYRKHVLEYDDILNQQRIAVYQYRRVILEGHEKIADLIKDLIADMVHELIGRYAPDKTNIPPAEHGGFLKALSLLIGIPVEDLSVLNLNARIESLSDELMHFLLQRYENFTREKDSTLSEQEMTARTDMKIQAQKWFMLGALDKGWKNHMLNLDHLREGIGLRGWGQKNPLLEYKREAFFMFEELMRQVRWEIVHAIFHLNIDRFNQYDLEKEREEELSQINLQGSDTVEVPLSTSKSDKQGRNEECLCGSGKKYKKCCGK
jgi:preprotein translocase subunit SecA